MSYKRPIGVLSVATSPLRNTHTHTRRCDAAWFLFSIYPISSFPHFYKNIYIYIYFFFYIISHGFLLPLNTIKNKYIHLKKNKYGRLLSLLLTLFVDVRFGVCLSIFYRDYYCYLSGLGFLFDAVLWWWWWLLLLLLSFFLFFLISMCLSSGQ